MKSFQVGDKVKFNKKGIKWMEEMVVDSRRDDPDLYPKFIDFSKAIGIITEIDDEILLDINYLFLLEYGRYIYVKWNEPFVNFICEET